MKLPAALATALFLVAPGCGGGDTGVSVRGEGPSVSEQGLAPPATLQPGEVLVAESVDLQVDRGSEVQEWSSQVFDIEPGVPYDIGVGHRVDGGDQDDLELINAEVVPEPGRADRARLRVTYSFAGTPESTVRLLDITVVPADPVDDLPVEMRDGG